MLKNAKILFNGWGPIIALVWLLLALGLLPGCHTMDETRERPRSCEAQPCSVPERGTSTLSARTTFDDYQGATLSIEHGVVTDDGRQLVVCGPSSVVRLTS